MLFCTQYNFVMCLSLLHHVQTPDSSILKLGNFSKQSKHFTGFNSIRFLWNTVILFNGKMVEFHYHNSVYCFSTTDESASLHLVLDLSYVSLLCCNKFCCCSIVIVACLHLWYSLCLSNLICRYSAISLTCHSLYCSLLHLSLFSCSILPLLLLTRVTCAILNIT